jgi:putative hemolysin
MWAAYFAEREGKLGDRFGCATVAEVVNSHKAFAAAMKSHDSHSEISI